MKAPQRASHTIRTSSLSVLPFFAFLSGMFTGLTFGWAIALYFCLFQKTHPYRGFLFALFSTVILVPGTLSWGWYPPALVAAICAPLIFALFHWQILRLTVWEFLILWLIAVVLGVL